MNLIIFGPSESVQLIALVVNFLSHVWLLCTASATCGKDNTSDDEIFRDLKIEVTIRGFNFVIVVVLLIKDT